MTIAFLGHQALLGVVAESSYGVTPSPGTIGALTNAYVFVSETLRKRGNIVERKGLRGTRSHVADDTRVGPYTVAGSLVLEPSPADLGFWFQHVLGGTPSGGSYPLADTIPSFTVGVARGPKNFRYTGCKIGKATFSGSQGALLRMTLEIVGQAETLDATSWPAISADVTGPYIFSDLALTINSLAREVRDFELVIDNALVTNRFMNSTVISAAPEGDRTVTLKTTHAWSTANVDLYDPGLAGYPGATLAFTSGAHSSTFTFGSLQAPADSPTTAQRQENFLAVNWTARKTGTTGEVAVTHS
jgi:hypothetical protein